MSEQEFAKTHEGPQEPRFDSAFANAQHCRNLGDGKLLEMPQHQDLLIAQPNSVRAAARVPLFLAATELMRTASPRNQTIGQIERPIPPRKPRFLAWHLRFVLNVTSMQF